MDIEKSHKVEFNFTDVGRDYFKTLKEHLENLTRDVEKYRARYEEAIAEDDIMVAATMLGYARNDCRCSPTSEREADIILMSFYRIAGIRSVTDHLKGSKK